MSKLVSPHGGQDLKPLILPEVERPDEIKRAKKLKKVPMASRETSDVIMMAMGAYTPLDGFMGESDWCGCCVDMKLSDGLFWPIPVTLSVEKELADARAYAATAFARDMLSVADNLSRALAAIPADLREDEKFKGLVVGLEATGRELESVFGRNGITKLESVGQPLDPNKHQAMMEVPSADAEPGTILVEMQAGYMIKDRLLRPAMVSVAKKPD